MFDTNSKLFTKAVSIVLAIVIVGVSFFIGVGYGQGNKSDSTEIAEILQKESSIETDLKPKGVNFDLFWEVWSEVEKKYVDHDSLDRQNMIYGAIQGMVKSLGDPYSQFLPPSQSKQFQQDISGSFGGIGAEIGIRKGVLTIISPLKNSPAEKAGLRAGDKILKVDDTVTADITLEEAVRIIRGKPGTKVRLTILRDDADKTKEITVIRDIIKIPVIETKKLEDGIFVIRLFHFTENAGFEFRKAVKEFFNSGSNKLILDLRNNPGGFLVVAVDIASWFLPSGEIVARERFADGREESYRSNGYRLLEKIPTVVLINQGSASASEIVAGALRDVRGIKLVGEKTFGKGSVQELIPFDDSSLKITIAKWLTPKGEQIDGKGLAPDFKVEVSAEDMEKFSQEGKDPFMEKAVEILRKR